MTEHQQTASKSSYLLKLPRSGTVLARWQSCVKIWEYTSIHLGLGESVSGPDFEAPNTYGGGSNTHIFELELTTKRINSIVVSYMVVRTAHLMLAH